MAGHINPTSFYVVFQAYLRLGCASTRGQAKKGHETATPGLYMEQSSY